MSKRVLYSSLNVNFGSENTYFVESANWKKNLFRLLVKFFLQTKTYDKIILLPTHDELSN